MSRSGGTFLAWFALTSAWLAVLATVRGPVAAQAQPQPQPAPAYVGSASCSVCHPATYNRWKNTRMANVVRDPKEHPDAIIPDLSQPNPLVTFTKDQIAWVYGSKWKQRYFTKLGDDYVPLGAQWDIDRKSVV